MLKLFDLKKPGTNAGAAGGNPTRCGPSAANLRIQKGISINDIRLKKGTSCFKQHGSVMAKERSHYACEMGIIAGIPI